MFRDGEEEWYIKAANIIVGEYESNKESQTFLENSGLKEWAEEALVNNSHQGDTWQVIYYAGEALREGFLSDIKPY